MKHLVIICLFFSLTIADDASEKIIQANNRFAPDIYKEVIKTETGNIVMSPLSAEMVLALLYSGCEGSTAQELSKALYLLDDKEKVRSGSKALLGNLQSNSVLTFQIANGMFIQEKFTLKKSFLDVAKNYFYANSQNVDFSKSQEAANIINKYVEDNTNNLIKNLVSPDVLSPATRLVLVNALRFKGNWSVPFSKSRTTKTNFYKTPTDIIQVDTLHHFEKHLNFFECQNLNAQFLELRFQGGDASMIIILPNDRNGLSTLEKQIVDIFTYNIPFESTYLNVALPKFKFETQIDFNKVLKGLGVNKMYDASQADLSGIAGGKGDLVVSQVKQKAFIDLNEGGVEAAAATFVGVIATAVHISEPPKNFVANHPFIYLLKYKKTIIFVGRVTEPKY